MIQHEFAAGFTVLDGRVDGSLEHGGHAMFKFSDKIITMLLSLLLIALIRLNYSTMRISLQLYV